MAFEELCSQLARLEARPNGSKFIRKGAGGDGGVECFIRLRNGSERGWQAKYVFKWDHLTTQLDSSMEAMIDKHPRMDEITICLPFDLPDSRPAKGMSARKKWERWKAKWKTRAAAEQRTLSIVLWDQSHLLSLLATDTRQYVGQLGYWFDTTRLTSEWFSANFEKACAALGSRYTPEINVELSLRKQFLAFARDPFLENTVRNWSQDLSGRSNDVLWALESANVNNVVMPQVKALKGSLETLRAAFQRQFPGPDSDLPLTRWKEELTACRNSARALEQIFGLHLSENGETEKTTRSARESLFRLVQLVDQIHTALETDTWRLANSRSVLLTGDAGSGKSHFLADFVKHQLTEGRPAILVPGSAMIEGDPWRQLMEYLDLPGDLQTKQFLGELDAAARIEFTRAIVCIDAINEHHGPDIWPDRLAAFLAEAQQFRHVATVLSCRTTYVEHIIPDSLPASRLERVVHPGFSGEDAAAQYLAMRGISRPGAPNLLPESQNPLFLKTLCDSLERQGLQEIPQGLRGVSEIFGYYHKSIVHSVTMRMKLNHHLEPVRRALERLEEILMDRKQVYAPLADVSCAFEEIVPSGGQREQILLIQLESEGLLTIEPLQQADGPDSKMVRFTFERYSDHRIADKLLSEHLDPKDIKQSFDLDTTLGQFVFGAKSYQQAGVIEAIAIQLPEKYDTEIIDVGPAEVKVVRTAFLDSLLWRKQEFFTDRTLELAKRLLDPDRIWDLFIKIATEPSNRFNATYLHEELSRLTMPERDATWSHYLNRNDGENDPVGVLISWAWQHGMGNISSERARLAALTLGWFLTSSNRAVRDKATKALVCLFASRLPLAVETLRAFADVDDLYIHERLFAAAYGAALQGNPEQGLSELALTTYELVFPNDSPPLNELLRDHARGIIHCAKWRGNLAGNLDFDRVQPPHNSPWPIKHVPDSVIESYTVDRNGSTVSDSIAMSSVHSGDFGRYIIDPIIRNWALDQLTTDDCPTEQDPARNWIRQFRTSATQEQLQAFGIVESAAKSLELARRLHHFDTSIKREVLEVAERAFEVTLPEDVWEAYRATSMDFVRLGNNASLNGHHTVRFDSDRARRWVCKRAHELGWTPERFALLESHSRIGRYSPKVERIGKKYQWLALHELVARMEDNLLFMGTLYGDEEPRPYKGAHELEFKLRDIDPSLLVERTFTDSGELHNPTW